MWFQGEIILHKPRENAISANWSIDEIMKDSYSHDSSWLGLEKNHHFPIINFVMVGVDCIEVPRISK